MKDANLSFECAFPTDNYPFITLAHGAGGRLTQYLLDYIFRPAFSNPLLDQQHDGAVITLPSHKIAMTTDSYVVHPLFYPGGNIGELAVTGTLNDLAMCGADPLYITSGFILNEGLPTTTLIQIVDAMRRTALKNKVQIIAGDIKVVEQSSLGGLYINTTGIGVVPIDLTIAPQHIQKGDAILISGDIGRHGLAVLAERQQFNFDPPILSDCAPLWPLVWRLLENNISLHCLRDLTRGGLAGALIELAKTTGLTFEIQEKDIPLSQQIYAACELLGLDPLYVANEGRMVLFIPDENVNQALAILHQFPEGKAATQIGIVSEQRSSIGEVILKTYFGSERALALFSGEQLPRIC
ncbi:MAG: hydrogenase expression/formation protein HypE [Candidatus Berkiellales bacterium]